MSLDSYITLGRSGLRVSPLCLSTMTFGEDWGWGPSVAESEALLASYLERGGNCIDTAYACTKGHSKVIIGDYFARTGRRECAVIATQFLSKGGLTVNGSTSPAWPKSPKHDDDRY